MVVLLSIRYFRVPSKITQLSIRNIVLSSPNGVKEFSNDHLFKKKWTKHELIDHLSSNICYEDDSNVVVNKPYGILARINRTKPVQFGGEGIACGTALVDILPDLSALFEAKNLDLVVHPQWLFSGVTILSKGKNNVNNILKDFEGINQFNSSYSYLAVVLGDVPKEFEDSFRISKNFEIIQDTKKHPKSFSLSYSHKVLGSSSGASLVKVDLNYNYLQCLRLILATKCFSPVLGDFHYSSRVTSFFGVHLLVPDKQEKPQKSLPPDILKVLQLSPDDVTCCPCHVHLYSIKFRVRNKKFVAAVPPPEYFVWTCERLGIKEVKQFMRNADGFDECRGANAAGL